MASILLLAERGKLSFDNRVGRYRDDRRRSISFFLKAVDAQLEFTKDASGATAPRK